MYESGTGVGGAETREGATLVGVEEAGLAGQLRESDGHNPLQYLGDSFEEYYYAKGCWRVIRGLARFIQDYPVGMFETGGVIPEGDQRGEHVEKDGGVDVVYSFPDLVGNAVRSRGRGRGALAQGVFYLV